MFQRFSLNMKHRSKLLLYISWPTLKTNFRKSVTVEKDIPLEVDAGFLTVTDLNPVDAETYK